MSNIIKFPENIAEENKKVLLKSLYVKVRNVMNWAADKNIGQQELAANTIWPLFLALWLKSGKNIVSPVDYIVGELAFVVNNSVHGKTLVDLSEDQVSKGFLGSEAELVSATQSIVESMANRTSVLNWMNKTLSETETDKRSQEELDKELEELTFD